MVMIRVVFKDMLNTVFLGDAIILMSMRAGKTTHIFQVNGCDLKFSGNFDSGNLRTVLQTTPTHF